MTGETDHIADAGKMVTLPFATFKALHDAYPGDPGLIGLAEDVHVAAANAVPDRVGDGAVAWLCRNCGSLTHKADRSEFTERGQIACCPERSVDALGVLAPAGVGGQELGAVASLLPTEGQGAAVLAELALWRAGKITLGYHAPLR